MSIWSILLFAHLLYHPKQGQGIWLLLIISVILVAHNFCFGHTESQILCLKFVNLFVAAAAESLQIEKPMDPCTPRGYVSEKEAWKLPPTSLIEKRRYMSTLSPGGNFSECRSASLKLLQKGKGNLPDFFTCLMLNYSTGYFKLTILCQTQINALITLATLGRHICRSCRGSFWQQKISFTLLRFHSTFEFSNFHYVYLELFCVNSNISFLFHQIVL